MPLPVRILKLLLCAAPVSAQLPFYTDDPAVTETGKWHFEFFNEFDDLQHPQFPSLRQNTANHKLNVGLPHNLELDVDSPYSAIYRAFETASSTGAGDTNMGVKWEFHNESNPLPALGVSFYVDVPTGDSSQQLGSGRPEAHLRQNEDRRQRGLFICRQHQHRRTGNYKSTRPCLRWRSLAAPRFHPSLDAGCGSSAVSPIAIIYRGASSRPCRVGSIPSATDSQLVLACWGASILPARSSAASLGSQSTSPMSSPVSKLRSLDV